MPKKTYFYLFALLSLTILLLETSAAQEYGVGNKLEYHGGTTHVRLGGGVNKNFPLKYKKVCLEDIQAYDPDSSATGTTDDLGDGFDTVATNTAGVPETSFDIEFIQDTEEMHNLLSISGLIAAQLKFRGRKLPGMSLDARGDKEFKLNDTTLNLVLKVKSNFGRQMVKDDSLKEEYQQMLENGEYEKFEKYCGTHYVAWQRRQGVVSAILTVSDLTEEQKQNLRASFEIGNPPGSQFGDDPGNDDGWGDDDGGDDGSDDDDGWGDDDDDDDWDDDWESASVERETEFQNEPLDDLVKTPRDSTPPGSSKGVGARFSINNFLKAVRKIGKKATLKFHANGGGGPQHLGKLASAFNGGKNSFGDVLEGIGYYLENFSFHSAPPVEYYLVPYFDYNGDQIEIDHAMLKNTYYEFVDVENNMVAIKDHLEKLSVVSDKKEVKYFRNKLTQLDKVRTELWEMGQQILKGETYTMDQLPQIPRVNWSKFIPQVKSINFSFKCYSQSTKTKCCATKNIFRPPAYWQASFDLFARVTLPHKIKSASLVLKNRTSRPITVAHAENGDAIDSDSAREEFNSGNRGFVTFNAARMTLKQNRERYVQLMSDKRNIPQGALVITLKNGQVMHIPLGRPKMKGNHGQWKTSKLSGSRTKLF